MTPTQEYIQKAKEEFRIKLNEVVNCMVRLEVRPFLQGLINERIPEEYGHWIFESEELESFLEQKLRGMEEKVRKESEKIALEAFDDIEITNEKLKGTLWEKGRLQYKAQVMNNIQRLFDKLSSQETAKEEE